MTIDGAALEHFRAGRDELVRQRDALNAAIASIDSVLDVLANDGGPPGRVAVAERNEFVHRAPQRRPSLANPFGSGQAAIINVMKSDPDRLWAPHEVHEGLVARDIIWEYSTTRSTVAKMGREGHLEKVGRGAYRLLPKDAETPAGTGVSEVETSPTEEGGGLIEEAFASPSSAEVDDHPQLGAPIGGPS